MKVVFASLLVLPLVLFLLVQHSGGEVGYYYLISLRTYPHQLRNIKIDILKLDQLMGGFRVRMMSSHCIGEKLAFQKDSQKF